MEYFPALIFDYCSKTCEIKIQVSVARLIKKVMIVNIFLDLDCKRNDFAAQMLQGPI